VKIIVITLFVVMLGSVIAPTFAQQFQEPDYTIRGAKVLGFEIDVETASLTILLDTRARGEIIIILPRNLIDARDGFDDIDFEIFVSSTKALTSYDEIKTSFDRTITIPIKRLNQEIVITGTHVFSFASTKTVQESQPQTTERKIADELTKEIPDGQAKLLIYSDSSWSGAYQSTTFDFTEINGRGDKSIIFECESTFGRQGVFGAKIQKLSPDGYLTIVVIQDQQIIAQGSSHEELEEILINGNCATGPAPGGCLIATATYGSELAPQVQLLRELRDNQLLNTESGSAFMGMFNDVYYSFSPQIADLERENPVFKEMVKISITPLLTSLSLLNYVDMDSEESVLGYGISLILLNVGMYIGIPVVMIVGIRKRF
jgi:hypothetical protein